MQKKLMKDVSGKQEFKQDLVFFCCTHIFFSVEKQRVSLCLGQNIMSIKPCLTLELDLYGSGYEHFLQPPP